MLPSTLLGIGEYTFNKSGIQEIEVPNNVIEIGGYAFANCTDLEYVKLSN